MERSSHSPPDDQGQAAVLKAYLLGTVDFEAALLLQKRLLYRHFRRSQPGRSDSVRASAVHYGRPARQPGPYSVRTGRTRTSSLAGALGQSRRRLHAASSRTDWPFTPILPLDRTGLNLAEYLERMGLALQDLLAEFHLPGADPGNRGGHLCRAAHAGRVRRGGARLDQLLRRLPQRAADPGSVPPDPHRSRQLPSR